MRREELVETAHYLGVVFPESYLVAAQGHDLAGLEGFYWFDPEDVCWFEDHPVSRTVSIDFQGVVIGEEPAGDVVVLKVDPERPERLEDTVYHLDRDGRFIEPIARDMLSLVVDLENQRIRVDRVEVVTNSGIWVGAGPHQVYESIRATLARAGWHDPPEHYDPEGTYFAVDVYPEWGGTFVWVCDLESAESQLYIARRLAVDLGAKVRAWEVQSENQFVQLVTQSGDGYRVRVRSVKCLRDGTMHPIRHDFTDRGALHGDHYQTSAHVMWHLVDDGGVRTTGNPVQMTFYRPNRVEELPPRLRRILWLAAEAEEVTVTPVGDRNAIRMDLTSTTEMAVVSVDELQTLREYVELDSLSSH